MEKNQRKSLRKRLAAIGLAFSLAITMIPMVSFAEEGVSADIKPVTESVTEQVIIQEPAVVPESESEPISKGLQQQQPESEQPSEGLQQQPPESEQTSKGLQQQPEADNKEAEPEVDDTVPQGMVAQIGDISYPSLQEAVDAVNDGESISLLSNVNENIEFKGGSNNVTIDLKGYTLSGAEDSNKPVVKVESGFLDITGDEGGKIEATQNTSVISLKGGSLNIHAGNVKQSGTGYTISNAAGTLTILGGSVHNTPEATRPVIRTGEGTETVVAGGKITAENTNAAIDNDNGTVTIEGGEIRSTGGYAVSGSGEKLISFIDDGKKAIVAGGTGAFEKPVSINFSEITANASVNYDGLNLVGIDKDDDLDTYKYIEFVGRPDVAEEVLTGMKYKTLQGAFDAAGKSAIISLLTNVQENIILSKDSQIMLDLNDKTLNGGDGTAIKLTKGSLTITENKNANGNGTITAKNTTIITEGSGTVKIAAGNITSSESEIYSTGSEGTLTLSGSPTLTPGPDKSTIVANNKGLLDALSTYTGSSVTIDCNWDIKDGDIVISTPNKDIADLITIKEVEGFIQKNPDKYPGYITLASTVLTELNIKTFPTKMNYRVGEVFDPAGMEVEAVYGSSGKKIIPNDEYTISPEGPLKAGDVVTISYTEKGITKKLGLQMELESPLGVSFVWDDGKDTVEVQPVFKDDMAKRPDSAPIKAGYTFIDWFLKGADKPFDFNTPITETTELIAKWEDVTAPSDLKISYEESGWKEFLNNATFGLFFKDTVNVKLTAVDEGTGVKEFAYTLSDGEASSNVKKRVGRIIATPTEGSLTFSVEPQYKGNITNVTATDHAGNTSEAIEKTQFFAVDGKAPTAPTVDTNGYTQGEWVKEHVSFTLSGAAAKSGIEKYQYSIDNGLSWKDAVIVESTKATETEPANVTKAEVKTNIDSENLSYSFRAVSNAGNEGLASEGIAVNVDTTAPVITGVNDGALYYTTQQAEAADQNLVKFTLDGMAAENRAAVETDSQLLLKGNQEAGYTMTAEDKAGNVTTATVNMKPIASLSVEIDNLSIENVTSLNKEAVESVKNAVGAVVVTDAATQEEKDALSAITDKATGLFNQIEVVAAEKQRIMDEAGSFNEESLKASDKSALEQLKTANEALLESGNLTEEEKTALKEVNAKIDALLAKIESMPQVDEQVQKVIDAITTLPDPEKVKVEDAEKIRAAKKAYDSLTNDQKLMVTPELVEKLNGVYAALEKLENKKPETNPADKPETKPADKPETKPAPAAPTGAKAPSTGDHTSPLPVAAGILISSGIILFYVLGRKKIFKG